VLISALIVVKKINGDIMTKLKHYITAPDNVNEAAYAGNVGFEEMVKFYGEATAAQIAKMEALIKKDDWMGFKALIKMVLGVKLK
jgi:hypothetical protein